MLRMTRWLTLLAVLLLARPSGPTAAAAWGLFVLATAIDAAAWLSEGRR